MFDVPITCSDQTIPSADRMMIIRKITMNSVVHLLNTNTEWDLVRFGVEMFQNRVVDAPISPTSLSLPPAGTNLALASLSESTNLGQIRAESLNSPALIRQRLN